MNTTMTSLVNALVSVKGCTIVTLDAVTCPKMNKRNNPYYGRVLKYTRTQLQFGYDYENAVNNRLERMGLERSFSASKLPWGEWVVPNKVISHNGETYLRFYTFDTNVPTEVYYLVDGRLATKKEVEEIKGFIPSKGESAKQSGVGLVEHQVQPRNYKVGDIKRVVVKGCEMFVNRELAEVGV